MYGADEKRRGVSCPSARVFPKLLSWNRLGRKYVSFKDCSFAVKKGREATARVVVVRIDRMSADDKYCRGRVRDKYYPVGWSFGSGMEITARAMKERSTRSNGLLMAHRANISPNVDVVKPLLQLPSKKHQRYPETNTPLLQPTERCLPFVVCRRETLASETVTLSRARSVGWTLARSRATTSTPTTFR